MYPYVVSSYNNSLFAALRSSRLFVLMIFLLLLTAGFVFELGKGALSIESKQTTYIRDDTFMINVKQISDNSSLMVREGDKRNFSSIRNYLKNKSKYEILYSLTK